MAINAEYLFAQDAETYGGTTFYVGGYVRDTLMDIEPNDVDLVCFDIEVSDFIDLCNSWGMVQTGLDFPVYRLSDNDGADIFEVTLPRRERSTGIGHSDFDIACDPHMSVAEDAARRDITINAIYQNVLTGELHDPFNGEADIEMGIIHPVAHFADDSIRVVRAARFALRYGFLFSDAMYEMICDMPKMPFVAERLGKELIKMANETNATWKERLAVFDMLYTSGWLRYIIPQLHDIWSMPYKATTHHHETLPEHVMMVWTLADRYMHDKVLAMICAFMHDSHKPVVQGWNMDKMNYTYHGHERIPYKYWQQFIDMNMGSKCVNLARLICENHMKFSSMPTAKSLWRVWNKLGDDIQHLAMFCIADQQGRVTQVEKGITHLGRVAMICSEWALAEKVTGKDLIAQGYQPGPKLGERLAQEHRKQFGAIYRSTVL